MATPATPSVPAVDALVTAATSSDSFNKEQPESSLIAPTVRSDALPEFGPNVAEANATLIEKLTLTDMIQPQLKPLTAAQKDDDHYLSSTDLEHSPNLRKREPATKKTKADPTTLEQFIEYAYGRKGQPLTLKPKVEKQIAQTARIDDVTLTRLLHLAASDNLLAVPHQILFLSQEITGFPVLKASLVSFVSSVMMGHMAFSDPGVQSALRNLPDGLSPSEALTRVAAFEPILSSDVAPTKENDLRELRSNAVRLLATWFAVDRNLTLDALSALLFQAVWQPAAKELTHDNSRLRALTDMAQAAGVGLACNRFRQQAIEAHAHKDQAQRETSFLREQITATEAELVDKTAELEAVRSELQAFRESSSIEMENLRSQHSVELTHLQHELEQLRGRLVNRLSESVGLLEVGLTAIRKEQPRVPVMLERAEHVVQTLRNEVSMLSRSDS